MSPEKLAVICRCGHARRFHLQGTIWQHYSTECTRGHQRSDEYAPGCMFFEPIESWERTFARALKDQGYVVLRRGEHGRFVS